MMQRDSPHCFLLGGQVPRKIGSISSKCCSAALNILHAELDWDFVPGMQVRNGPGFGISLLVQISLNASHIASEVVQRLSKRGQGKNCIVRAELMRWDYLERIEETFRNCVIVVELKAQKTESAVVEYVAHLFRERCSRVSQGQYLIVNASTRKPLSFPNRFHRNAALSLAKQVGEEDRCNRSDGLHPGSPLSTVEAIGSPNCDKGGYKGSGTQRDTNESRVQVSAKRYCHLGILA
jgi:hypothetical protein